MLHSCIIIAVLVVPSFASARHVYSQYSGYESFGRVHCLRIIHVSQFTCLWSFAGFAERFAFARCAGQQLGWRNPFCACPPTLPGFLNQNEEGRVWFGCGAALVPSPSSELRFDWHAAAFGGGLARRRRGCRVQSVWFGLLVCCARAAFAT